MILPNTKKTVIVNAGHWDDPKTPRIDGSGAVYGKYVEEIEAANIRDVLVPILESRGYKVHSVPDDINLRKSIAWANKVAPELNDALAVAIHLNYLSDHAATGTEAFYADSNTDKQIAAAISNNVSESLGIRNRGAKPDSAAFVGYLGWLRKTTMWATLVEVCFITNENDMAILQSKDGYNKAAQGIANGIDEVFGIKRTTEASPEIKTPVSGTKCSLSQFTLPQLISEIVKRLTSHK